MVDNYKSNVYLCVGLFRRHHFGWTIFSAAAVEKAGAAYA